MASVTSASRYITSASRYHQRYQSRSSMYIRGLIPRNSTELAEAVPIGFLLSTALNTMFCSSLLTQRIATKNNRQKCLTLITREMLVSSCFCKIVSVSLHQIGESSAEICWGVNLPIPSERVIIRPSLSQASIQSWATIGPQAK